MDTLKIYKYATIILSVVVVILLALLVTNNTNKEDPKIQAKTALSNCQSDIEGWNAKYASSTAPNAQLSPIAKEVLSNILTQCSKDAHQTAASL